jgi:long-chain acyl-CoA synthetase
MAATYADRPWVGNYPPGATREIDASAIGTITDVFRTSVSQFATRQAYESFGKSITFAEVGAAAEAFAAALQARGLKKGDRIALMMPNILAYPVCIFGALLAGCTVVNCNPLYTPRELTHQLKDSGARGIVIIENFAHTLQQTLADVKLDFVVVSSAGDLMGLKGHVVNLVARYVKKVVPPFNIAGAIPFAQFLAGGRGARFSAPALTKDDIAFLQYTGGTTGVSKGATLTHGNVTANLAQVRNFQSAVLQQASEPCMITALPLYHIYALTCCCLYMAAQGGKCLLIANPRDIPGFIKTLKTAKFTMTSGVNTLYNALTNHPEFKDIDFSRLEFASAGGMATQQAVAKRWKELTGKPIIEGYGLSETAPVVTVNRHDITDFSGTIGYPVPSTDVAIRDDAGNDVPIGEPGELCVRGPQVMIGYWNRPDETAKVMTPDGYFRTGDIALMQPDGQFKIVDRKKDMVLVSGFNVFPNEVEDVLAMHPGILEAAVVGVPDATSGEAVCAHIVKRDPALTEESVITHCRANLTAYKVPRRIVFRETLPKTNVGKVLRRELRDKAP